MAFFCHHTSLLNMIRKIQTTSMLGLPVKDTKNFKVITVMQCLKLHKIQAIARTFVCNSFAKEFVGAHFVHHVYHHNNFMPCP